MTANCPACGAHLPDTAVRCPQCGHRLAELAAGEELLWEGTFSARALVPGWLAMAAVTAGAGVIARRTLPGHRSLVVVLLVAALCFGSLGLYALYRKLSAHYRLTNRRFLQEQGLLRRVSRQVAMIQVDDVAYAQRRFERLAGVGTIKIMPRDPACPPLFLEGVAAVRRVARLIDDVRRTERMRHTPMEKPP